MYGNGVATGIMTIQAVTKTTRRARLPVTAVSTVAALGAAMLPAAMCLAGTSATRTTATTASVSVLFVTPTSVG